MRGMIACSIVMSLFLIVLELATNIAPRWPSPFGWSSVLGILCALTVWGGCRQAALWLPEKSRRKRLVVWSFSAAGICLLTYSALDAFFCWCDPPARNYDSRVVTGFIWASEDIRTLAQTTSVIDLLRGSPWDAEQIWAPWSIAVVRLGLFATWTMGWLLTSGGVSLLCAEFLLNRQKSRRQRKVEGSPQLNGPQGLGQFDANMLLVLSDAIHDAFPTPQQLRQVLASRLQDDIYNYSGMDSGYPTIRFKLVESYNSKWKIGDLVSALLAENPTNIKLQDFQKVAFIDKSTESQSEAS